MALASTYFCLSKLNCLFAPSCRKENSILVSIRSLIPTNSTTSSLSSSFTILILFYDGWNSSLPSTSIWYSPTGMFLNKTRPCSSVFWSYVDTLKFFSYACLFSNSFILSLSSPKKPRPLPCFFNPKVSLLLFLVCAEIGLPPLAEPPAKLV